MASYRRGPLSLSRWQSHARYGRRGYLRTLTFDANTAHEDHPSWFCRLVPYTTGTQQLPHCASCGIIESKVSKAHLSVAGGPHNPAFI